MTTVDGDLIALARAGTFDVIIHGCNCQCVMGAGIAKSIRALFPAAYRADCNTKKGDRDKLGTYSSAEVMVVDNQPLVVVNAYTQYGYRRQSTPNVDYDAIRSVFQKVKTDFSGKRIGFPAIGAGLAGGSWSIIEEIIEEELAGEDFTFVRFVP
ncbi:phosphatase [Neolewinella aurantiaca]|uniref:Phosphatase n=1 Tax=Neolewinella aurantiaca TaxID=2602767 RepID=A0A5C7FW46_9BACT|nr:macro domain-containing protein [Neolewinella aurantiaca]TXF90604.1 phosphatase [Neolewinella aurantiaca]